MLTTRLSRGYHRTIRKRATKEYLEKTWKKRVQQDLPLEDFDGVTAGKATLTEYNIAVWLVEVYTLWVLSSLV